MHYKITNLCLPLFFLLQQCPKLVRKPFQSFTSLIMVVHEEVLYDAKKIHFEVTPPKYQESLHPVSKLVNPYLTKHYILRIMHSNKSH